MMKKNLIMEEGDKSDNSVPLNVPSSSTSCGSQRSDSPPKKKAKVCFHFGPLIGTSLLKKKESVCNRNEEDDGNADFSRIKYATNDTASTTLANERSSEDTPSSKLSPIGSPDADDRFSFDGSSDDSDGSLIIDDDETHTDTLEQPVLNFYRDPTGLLTRENIVPHAETNEPDPSTPNTCGQIPSYGHEEYIHDYRNQTELLIDEQNITIPLAETNEPDPSTPNAGSQMPSNGRKENIRRNRPDLLIDEINITPLAETDETNTSTPSVYCCQIPFNGHKEDIYHFDSCDIVMAGLCWRSEHSKWLKRLPSDRGATEMVNTIVGLSCKGILLNGKCSEVCCTFKHPVVLDFDFPPNQRKVGFDLFTKWFLENAADPDFRSVMNVLSQLPLDHDDTLWTVLSYSGIILRLTNKVYKQALSIKLVHLLVNAVNLEPWEAVRTLLVFSVTQTTSQPEIEDFLNSFSAIYQDKQFKNHLVESVSCLWHINGTFVCPRPILIALVKECLVNMPSDVKLLKDKMIADLMKLPRPVILKELPLIDKFLTRFYPQNSRIAHFVMTSVLYRSDPPIPGDVSYKSSRVKSTGPVNPKWDYWDILEAQSKGFDLAQQTGQNNADDSRSNQPRFELFQGDGSDQPPAGDLCFENLQGVVSEDIFKILSKVNMQMYKLIPEEIHIEPLREALHTCEYTAVVKSMISSGIPERMMEMCTSMLEELRRCNKSMLFSVVYDILMKTKGYGKLTVQGIFLNALNSLVVSYHRERDFQTALVLLKAMRLAEVNHFEHIPDIIDQPTFLVICSDVLFQSRLFPEAIRCLAYKDTLNLDGFIVQSPHFRILERLVIAMLKLFFKERLPSFAVNVFRLVLLSQSSLHYPIDIAKYYERVIYFSFIPDLKKNVCPSGEGANLYIMVDRLCGNYEKFNSLTYRTLIVELHRANAPDDVIRRTLLLCLRTNVYPDFTCGLFYPLILDSQLTTEEMVVYLKHYFAYYSCQNYFLRLEDQPFVVRFSKSLPPAKNLFSVATYITKTPRTVPEALERLESALQELAGPDYFEMDPVFTTDRMTIPVQGMTILLDKLKC